MGGLWPVRRETPGRTGDGIKKPRLRTLAVPEMVSLAHAASGAVDSAAGHRRLEPFGGRRRSGDWPGYPADAGGAGLAMVKPGR